ncbi:type 1 glutamine amidotransferase domain-containing protein [Wenzhouxiangella sp. XN79A]|uniref:type 1 glutamine amidotransferase domain-containing protein n=1 Tax=Wenzhouxiangella sp. XN79A TaxID=2724193 RepID=UPI00144A94A8|nr:type 1 glutamine amidotransferase domain-containing protein [Wenzhouxiangella sp. XN79A]NKI34714.1 type 1 glutamine amidotransferase domain-containing protein [Wenzhouxiangella sp. XN79A]
MKILMVLTSHDRLGNTGEKTGFWLEEFAAPYYAFVDAGAEVTLASPAGGQPPLDPKSDAEDAQTEATRRFKADHDAQKQLAHTHRLAEVDAADFDAVFYPGGHGPMWDLAENADSQALIRAFVEADKPVGAVCHAPAALTGVKTDNGYLMAGKRVTGFTNEEEDGVGLTEVVPFLLENRLKQRGARFRRGEAWGPHVEVDGRLVTGQNPASSEPAAVALLDLLRG